jgi:hypothetical protein
MDEYFLPLHVHCCQRGDAFVFLDLKQDDYTLITGEAAGALRTLAETAPAEPSATIGNALRELVSGGLLTTDPRAGRRFTATHSDLAMEPLLDSETPPHVTVRLSDWVNFIAACTTAAVRLRWHKIENTVAAVARRKALHGDRDIDLEQARHLTAVFQRLRSLFPANYLCLFDSLALIEFLARYRVYPTWVFGVKLEPWAAHCWIQQGQFAFNEGVEEAASYTPIMAI